MEKLDFVGGLGYISELTNNVASASNTEFHARIIAEKFIKSYNTKRHRTRCAEIYSSFVGKN